MQNPQFKDCLELKAAPQDPLKGDNKKQEAEGDRVEDQIKQIKNEERQPQHRHDRNDLLDLIRNNEARIIVQGVLKDVDREDKQSLDRMQQPKGRRGEEAHHPQGQGKGGQAQ